MSETKFDITLQSWMTRTADRLEAVAPKTENPFAQQVLLLTVNLLHDAYEPYQASVAAVLKENEEAAQAAEVVVQAEAAVEASYASLHATAQAAYYLAIANPAADAELLQSRLKRGMPLPPSTFDDLGVDRTRSVMATALRYANDALGTDHPVVIDAQAAHDAFVQAIRDADSESAEAVQAMQKLFAARATAKHAYTAARQFVAGALSLDADESIRQLMPAIRTMYRSKGSSTSPEGDVVVSDPINDNSQHNEPVET